MKIQTTYDKPLLTALENAAPHDHMSLIYEGSADHYDVAIPFMRLGLARGEKCVYIADDGTEAAVRDAMHSQAIDVERAIATNSLVLESKEGAFLKHGSFDPEWMTTFWQEATSEALRQGFSALRATGETEWVLCGAPGIDRWMEYESRLSETLAGLNCFALCQYNRQVLPSEIILDVIRTHPTVIYRGAVCENLYYLPPDEFLGTNVAAREAERLLTNIRERAEIDSTLRQHRKQLRVLAHRLMRAQDEERRHIAQMLHETTAQNLAAMKMLLTRLSGEAHRLGEAERDFLSQSISLVEQSIAEIRTVSYLLHPPFLDEAGLLSALRWYASGFAQRSGIDVDLDVPEEFERLAIDTETVLFRIVQESLTNIHRHAGAKMAYIRLRRDAESLVLEIEDRGRGIPQASLTGGRGAVGVGIASMSERIEELGGRFEITSSDSGKTGTTVRVWLPLTPEVDVAAQAG